MKEIQLTKGFTTIVDDSDFEYLSQWKWYYSHGYAARNLPVAPGKRKIIKMHTVIMQPADGLFVDHINVNRLDNRRSNLRLCRHRDNMRNKKKQRNGKVRFKGVFIKHSKNGRKPRYISKITVNGKFLIKSFPFTPEGEIQAAKRYNELAKQYFGEFARLNEV